MINVTRFARGYRRRLGISLVIGLVLEALVLWVGAGSGGARALPPATALAWNSVDARTQARLSEQLIGTGRLSDRTRARALSQAALMRDPTVAAAARNLALLAALADDEPLARRRTAYALMLTKRDLPALLMVIEDQVRQGNVDGALHYYDVALRSTRKSGPVLTPVLVAAMADNGLAKAIPEYLFTHRPPWSNGFLLALIQQGQAWDHIADAFVTLRLHRYPIEPGIARQAVRTLVDAGAFAPADRLYRAFYPERAARLLRDPTFAIHDAATPFDWDLANESGRTASPAGGERGVDLLVEVGRDQSGVLARQLLALRPGRYRVSAMLTLPDGAPQAGPGLTWSLACADTPAEPFANVVTARGGTAARRWAGEFSVSGGCSYQWLTLVSGYANEPFAASVSGLRLQRR